MKEQIGRAGPMDLAGSSAGSGSIQTPKLDSTGVAIPPHTAESPSFQRFRELALAWLIKQ